MENNLRNESSPYLLQHKSNPVNWYPWCEEAFEKAKAEDKPVFLSIGYSSCHWCHVMNRESFEDNEVAEILNQYFVSIKVDGEERPDIDSVYMSICQAFTGSGGWPMSVIITPDQKPLFAGTYFPKRVFVDLLTQIRTLWQNDRESLIQSGNEVIGVLSDVSDEKAGISEDLINTAVREFENAFDSENGGFGYAPKFPTPHNLLFLMHLFEHSGNKTALEMAEKTLLQMYKGGLFDHVGFGFSRYSTDKYFLVPHFEKMLYDNALLMMSYIKCYDITGKEIYKEVAEKTAEYVLREMTGEEGGFFSAQDADSEGVEGKYYLFDYDEIINLLGQDAGEKFNSCYGITKDGNFEGKSIPNLLYADEFDKSMEKYLPEVYEYRKTRTTLALDDKALTVWNSLMISGFAMMYRVLNQEAYLDVAKKAVDFVDKNLTEGDILYVSYRDGKRSVRGFLDDYAFYAFALINIYEASLEQKYLDKAISLCEKAVELFYDNESGGFYLNGKGNEQLILKLKETYDGAIPSGNSVMAYNLVRLAQITEFEEFEQLAHDQLEFMSGKAADYPIGHSFFMLALSMHLNPPVHIVCLLKDTHEKFPLSATVKIIRGNSSDYPLINGKTTYYVCKNKSCLPPTNHLEEVL